MSDRMRAWVATPLGEEAAGGEMIWVAGHSASIEGSGIAGGAQFEEFGEQFALAMERLGRTLHEAGASWDNIVSARIHVPQPEDLPQLEALLREWHLEFDEGRQPLPALTILCTRLRPGLRFEIECVALRPGPNLHVGG